MICYRTTSGRLIDLWDLPAAHLGLASLFATRIHQERNTIAHEENLRALILRDLSRAGVGQDLPADELLRTFVMDLTRNWHGAAQDNHPEFPTIGSDVWHQRFRRDLVAALGLDKEGGKSTVARQLGCDISHSERFTKALATPKDATRQERGDLLNPVEHLLHARLLRLTVTEALPDRLYQELGTFQLSPRFQVPFRVHRTNLALGRFVRHQLVGTVGTARWRGHDLAHADLAWALGGWNDDHPVVLLTQQLEKAFWLATREGDSAIPRLNIDRILCSNPDVRTAFHLGFFDAHGWLPVPESPEALYEPLSTETQPESLLGDVDVLGSLGEGPFPAPGDWIANPLGGDVQENGDLCMEDARGRLDSQPTHEESILQSIFKEVDRVRHLWPLAVWVATGGATQGNATGSAWGFRKSGR